MLRSCFRRLALAVTLPMMLALAAPAADAAAKADTKAAAASAPRQAKAAKSAAKPAATPVTRKKAASRSTAAKAKRSKVVAAPRAVSKPARTPKASKASALVAPATVAALPILSSSQLGFKSNAAFVVDEDTGEALAQKNPDTVMPIASLTKLMTGLVVVDSKLPMDEVLEIGSEDVDTFRNTHSRLTVGTRLRRDEMLLLALMSSENRAAMALSRHYPGGRPAFIAQMNAKAKALGMSATHYADPAGLSNDSVSTARDLHRLVGAAYAQPILREYTTQTDATVTVNGRELTFLNSNRLVRGDNDWDIDLQKTGFTNEAGRCLIMHVNMLSRRLAMIFLDSNGTMTRYADAARVRRMLEAELNRGRARGVQVSSAAAS